MFYVQSSKYTKYAQSLLNKKKDTELHKIDFQPQFTISRKLEKEMAKLLLYSLTMQLFGYTCNPAAR